MKQVCAMCGGENVYMTTDGKSSDRVEQYVCKVCDAHFFAKRPTKRVAQRERGRLEYIDTMASLAMQGFIMCQARPENMDKSLVARWAYNMAEKMYETRLDKIEKG